MVRRAEMLAELMRLKSTSRSPGTHGKTTTTSMIAALLDAGKIDPTVINGGIIEQYGSNARLGAGEWMVVEADESDGSFLRLDATIAVVTNIDPEHLDHYGDFDGVKDAFVEFIHNVPFYGAAILCIDHPEVQAVIGKVRDRRVVTYGFNLQADICGVNILPDAGGNVFDVIVRRRAGGSPDRRRAPADAGTPQCPERARRDRHGDRDGLPRRGHLQRLSLRVRRCEAALHQGWRSAQRRGRGDDHRRLRPSPGRDPRRVVGGARKRGTGRVIAVVQPHRYTRLRDLMDEFQSCFNEADRSM